jgi:hypothetical protein
MQSTEQGHYYSSSRDHQKWEHEMNYLPHPGSKFYFEHQHEHARSKLDVIDLCDENDEGDASTGMVSQRTTRAQEEQNKRNVDQGDGLVDDGPNKRPCLSGARAEKSALVSQLREEGQATKMFVDLLVNSLRDPNKSASAVNMLLDLQLLSHKQEREALSHTPVCFNLIHGAMKDHLADPIVQDNCLALLAVLACKHPVNRAAFHSVAAAAAIVYAMRIFSNVERVQMQGCGALLQLASCDFCDSYEQQKKIVTAGGIHAIVAAMVAFRMNPRMQNAGSICFALLAHNFRSEILAAGGGSLLAANKCYLSQLPGNEHVLETLTTTLAVLYPKGG